MLSARFNLSQVRIVRFLISVCVCAVLVLSYALPAYSYDLKSNKTDPTQGEPTQLLDIEGETQKQLLKGPMSREETQAKANEGINEIQGSADADKMKRPENSQGTTVEEKFKNAFEKVTGKD